MKSFTDQSLLMCFQSARTSSLFFLISFYQSDLYIQSTHCTQSLLLCSLKALHVWICNFYKSWRVHVRVISVYDYVAVWDSRPSQMSATLSQESSWSFPRWPAELLPFSGEASLPESALARRAHKTGDLAHHSPPGQRSNFWRSSPCSWTSCTHTKLGSVKKSGNNPDSW